MTPLLRVVGALGVAAVVSLPSEADACGCFAGPTTASTPVVQAGERIFFAVQNGKVIAHIQIQYSGDARDFGWLLPLPSVPVLKAGSDELFTALLANTDPQFQVQGATVGNCPNRGGGCGPVLFARSASAGNSNEPPPSPLVFTASVGPYDAAVLKADDRTELLTWLSNNRYVVPTTSDAVLGPYLRQGAYFLALKLTSGKTAGDLSPIVVEYAAELPMIPITLTSIGATPDMGVQVFLVGNGRAFSRNYRHVELNQTLLDWENPAGVSNYQALVTRAVASAPGKHAFVTDFAGSTEPLRGVLASEDRYGTESTLAQNRTPASFIDALWLQGYGLNRRQDLFPPALEAILLRMLPVPASLAARGVTEEEWFRDLEALERDARQSSPRDFDAYPPFDPAKLARDIFAEYVSVMRETNALFTTFPKLTRLYTTLSPQDMTRDPVFSFNAALPDVARLRSATRRFNCDTNESRFVVADGTEAGTARPVNDTTSTGAPALRIETITEEGAPTVEVDNAAAIRSGYPPERMATGCTAVVDPLWLGLLALVRGLRRRR